jgi:ABC-2 type transport system permease protein
MSIAQATDRVTRADAGRAAARPARVILRTAAYSIRRRRFAALVWGLPLSLMSVLVCAVFPAVRDSQAFTKLLDNYPDALKEAFDVSNSSFQTIQGYMAAEVFSLIAPFVICFFLIRALADAVCGSEERGTLDVLLSAPVRRRDLVAGWLLGDAVVLLGILAAFWAVTWLSGIVFGVDLPAGDAAAGTLNLFPLAIFAGGVTVLLAGAMHRSSAVVGIAAGILLAMYLIEVLGGFSGVIDAIRPLSAFHYYGSAIEDGIDVAKSVGLVAAGGILAWIGALLFERRDIH